MVSHFGNDLDWGKGCWGVVLKNYVNKVQKWKKIVNKLKPWIYYVKTVENYVVSRYLQK